MTKAVRLREDQYGLLQHLLSQVRQAQAEVQKAQQRLDVAVRMARQELDVDPSWRLDNLDQGFVPPDGQAPIG